MMIKVKKPLTKAKLDNAEKLMNETRGKAKGFNARKYAGKLKGVFGNPLEYQKKVRNEWS